MEVTRIRYRATGCTRWLLVSARRARRVREAATHNVRSRAAAARSVAGLAVLVAGCGQPATPTNEIDSEVPIVLTDGPVDAATKVFGSPPVGQSIVDFYLNGDGSLRWAREVSIHTAIARCMSENGFDFPPIGFTRADIESESRPRRFHIPLSRDEAEADGYSDAAADPLPDIQAQNGTGVADQPAAYADAEYECGRDAIENAYNDKETYDSLNAQLVTLRESFFDAFWSSPAVVELNLRWSECMTSAGIEASDPASLRAATLARSPQNQVEVATTDERCREDVEYDERILTMFESADSAFAFENSELLRQLRQASGIPESSAE